MLLWDSMIFIHNTFLLSLLYRTSVLNTNTQFHSVKLSHVLCARRLLVIMRGSWIIDGYLIKNAQNGKCQNL